MTLLDTNVLSELMRLRPSAGVVRWLDEQPDGDVYTSAVSRAEIELGLALMPEGRRRDALHVSARSMFDQDFSGRCLPFDEGAARHYARVVSSRRRVGRPMSVEDAQIAAIALANRMPLATRNIADFEQIVGLELLNPWADGGS